jgi:uncharacterized protein (TIGR03067 family)
MRTTLLFAAAAVLLVAAEAREDEAGKELQKFQGTWAMVSGEKDGEKVADEHVKKSKMTWKGKQVSLLTPHQSKEVIRAETTVDPSKSPKQMDWVRSTEPGKGKTMHAIYEFIDADHYRVCFAPPGKERPKEFRTRPGTGHTLHVWKRVKE